jgi:nucleoside-diphosphate-sugar epimerase
MKVLITGAFGYLGSVLCFELHNRGYEVVACDAGFFADSLISSPTAPLSTPKRIDVRDLHENMFDGIEAVVHLAGISNDPMGRMTNEAVYDPSRVYTKQLAECCKRLGVKFIFASSCSVYGIANEHIVDESSTVRPQTGYSLNKWQIEQDLAQLADEGFSPIALRFATVFGPSPRIRFDIVINMLVGMAVATGKIILNSDGGAWRPNLHIQDLCESVHRCLQLKRCEPNLLVMNVGDERNNLSILDIAKTVKDSVAGSEIYFLSADGSLDSKGLVRDRKVEGSDSRSYKVSFAKIREVLPGFKCKWSVKEGVSELVKWLSDIPLDERTFHSRRYYRLQHLEDLISDGRLSEDLRWN